MKGFIFGLLGDAVSANFGDDTWDVILARAGASGVYTALGRYPDAELLALVDATADAIGSSPREVLRWLGRATMPALIAQYPPFFEARTAMPDLVRTLDTVVRCELRQRYPCAASAHFQFPSERDRLTVGYRAPRKRRWVAHGLAERGTAQVDGTRTIARRAGNDAGNPGCQLEIRWAR